MHLDKSTLQNLAMAAVFVLALVVWVIAILLLMAVTRQLLETLSYIVELAQLS